MKQRGFGFIELVAVLIAAAFFIGAITMLVHTVTTFIERTHQEGRDQGIAERDALYAGRDNKKLIAANALILKLSAEARGEEARRSKAVLAALAKHNQEVKNDQAKLDSLRNRLADGALVLRWHRDPIETGTGGAGSGVGVVSGVAGDPAGSAGLEPGGIISRRDRAFLLSEAARAYAKVRALQLCRGVLLSERKGQ